MRDTRLKQMKRQDLYSIYRKGLVDGQFSSMRDAGLWICTQPAPHYYVSPEFASWLVGRIIAGQSLDDLNPSTQRMARQLYRNYEEYLRYHPDNKRSRVEIMNELVDQPAPEFYMTPDAIRRALRGVITSL